MDSGLGLPIEVQEKMMQPFFTTKGFGKGTGLGLSISLGIAKNHNGDLYYNKNSKNTEFILKIPKAVNSKIA
jgi:signal transduction histidine kinase